MEAHSPDNLSARFLRHRTLVIILAVALLLRLAVIPLLSIHHPDELWQYLERAHKLAFGRGVETVDYRLGFRTWILPFFMAPFMWIGDAVAPRTLFYLYLPKGMLALLSLTIVWSWWKLGTGISRTHAVLGAIIAAIWVDLIYFAGRFLTEPVSMALFFPAAAILHRKDLGRRELIIAGFLLGLAFAVRFQLAPALLCLVLWTEWRRFRQTLHWLVLGGLGALALDGVIDLMTGHVAFRWIVENIRFNIIQGKSSEFGETPSHFYLYLFVHRWGWAYLPILLLAAIGTRRFPALAFVAVVNLAAHSLVPHKEWRFILLSSEIFIFLAAIGTVDALNLIHARSRRRILGAIACVAWGSLSLMLAFAEPLNHEWRAHRPLLRTLQGAGKIPGVCGLAIYETKWPLSVSYTYYHRDTPIFGFKGDEFAFRAHADRFNVVIGHPGRPPGGSYTRVACESFPHRQPPLCVYHRPGGCRSLPAEEHEIDNFLKRRGV